MKRRLFVVSLLLFAVVIANCSPRTGAPPSPTPPVIPASSQDTESPAIAAVQAYLKGKLEAEVKVLFEDSTLTKESRKAHVQSFDEIAAWLNGTWPCQHLGDGKGQVKTVYPYKSTEKSKYRHFREGLGMIQEMPDETAPK